MKDRYDISVMRYRHDRHSIVTKIGIGHPTGRMPRIFYLLQTAWPENDIAIGKTLVSSRMIDRVTKTQSSAHRRWDLNGSTVNAYKSSSFRRRSAGASFCRLNGGCGTPTDGFIPHCCCEMTAKLK
jgi:phosphoglucomutase